MFVLACCCKPKTFFFLKARPHRGADFNIFNARNTLFKYILVKTESFPCSVAVPRFGFVLWSDVFSSCEKTDPERDAHKEGERWI